MKGILIHALVVGSPMLLTLLGAAAWERLYRRR